MCNFLFTFDSQQTVTNLLFYSTLSLREFSWVLYTFLNYALMNNSTDRRDVVYTYYIYELYYIWIYSNIFIFIIIFNYTLHRVGKRWAPTSQLYINIYTQPKPHRFSLNRASDWAITNFSSFFFFLFSIFLACARLCLFPICRRKLWSWFVSASCWQYSQCSFGCSYPACK